MSDSRSSKHHENARKMDDDLAATDNQNLVQVEDDFYEIERIVGWRGYGKSRQYKIRWKTLPGQPRGEDTWEYSPALCDTALEDALALVRKDKKNGLKERLDDDDEDDDEGEVEYVGSKKGASSAKQTVVVPPPAKKEKPRPVVKSRIDSNTIGSNVSYVEGISGGRLLTSGDEKGDSPARSRGLKRKRPKAKAKSPDPRHQMTPEERRRYELARGNDIELVDFRQVQRIDVNDTMAGAKVSEMRRFGIPCVLTGHGIWPAFSSRWLSVTAVAEAEDELSLSSCRKLQMEKLIADIGDEDIPIVAKNYDETNPVNSVMKASTFVSNHWPNSDGYIYMQQWQFTNSNKVANDLLEDDECSPPAVLHNDLLSYWLNDGGNPFQYLFMGSTGTMSKMHKDPGGLEILIAPIVGEKECVLVHRDDGEYLYNYRSKLDEIDLNRFPLTACTRAWKTVVKAGEILVMPHDTYHQCRNLTPCLSYHRLHLDYVNLSGFLHSFFRQERQESIEHEEILWNCVYNLCDKLDEYVEKFKEGQGEVDPIEEAAMNEHVMALRHLRPICLHAVKSCEEQISSSLLQYTAADWKRHIRELDISLFDYRHRNEECKRRFRPSSLLSDHKVPSSEDDSDDDGDERIEYKGKWQLNPFFETLASSLNDLPPCMSEDDDLVISDSIFIKPKDHLQVRLPGLNRRLTVMVDSIKENMDAVFVSYDDLPTEFDEFVPMSKVQGSVASTAVSMSSTVLRPAMQHVGKDMQQKVRCIPPGSRKVCADGNEIISSQYADIFSQFTPFLFNQIKKHYNAKVVRKRKGTFYRVTMLLGPSVPNQIQRWMSRDMFLRKLS